MSDEVVKKGISMKGLDNFTKNGGNGSMKDKIRKCLLVDGLSTNEIIKLGVEEKWINKLGGGVSRGFVNFVRNELNGERNASGEEYMVGKYSYLL